MDIVDDRRRQRDFEQMAAQTRLLLWALLASETEIAYGSWHKAYWAA
jgi:hypothetical protein